MSEHIYWAMGKARELWGDNARARTSYCVQNDGRLNILHEVGFWTDSEQRWFGGISFDEALENAQKWINAHALEVHQ
jgi:hypothetical protein